MSAKIQAPTHVKVLAKIHQEVTHASAHLLFAVTVKLCAVTVKLLVVEFVLSQLSQVLFTFP